MDKRIVVPDFILDAFMEALLEGVPDSEEKKRRLREGWRKEVGAVLRAISENPIVPTLEQVDSLREHADRLICREFWQELTVEWQRRMFLAPGPVVPEEVKDLMWEIVGSDIQNEAHNNCIIEAFNRGKKAAIR
jgi:hypothetical protein